MRKPRKSLFIGNPRCIDHLIAGAYLDQAKASDAIRWLDRLPMLDTVSDAFDAAIQEKRAGRNERSAPLFQAAGDAVRRCESPA